MEDLDKNMVALIAGFLLFFGMLFGFATYDNSMRHACRIKAIERGMNSSDVQVVCKT